MQDKHYNIRMTQRSYTDGLKIMELPHWCKEGEQLTAAGVRQLRGGNGALQWLVTNSRPDLAAAVS